MTDPGGTREDVAIPTNLIGQAVAPQALVAFFIMIPLLAGVGLKLFIQTVYSTAGVDPSIAAYAVIVPGYVLELYYVFKKWMETHSNDWVSLRRRIAGADVDWDEDLMLDAERGGIRVLGKVVAAETIGENRTDGPAKLESVTLAATSKFASARLASLRSLQRPRQAEKCGLLAEFNFSSRQTPRLLAWVPYEPEKMLKFTGSVGLIINPFMFVSRRVAKATYIQLDWTREEDGTLLPMGYFSDYSGIGREAAEALPMPVPTGKEVAQAFGVYDQHERSHWYREAQTQRELRDHANTQRVNIRKEIREEGARLAEESGALNVQPKADLRPRRVAWPRTKMLLIIGVPLGLTLLILVSVFR